MVRYGVKHPKEMAGGFYQVMAWGNRRERNDGSSQRHGLRHAVIRSGMSG